jgi:FKBP-type peptidyl-prolyl cis-trans isomerase
MKKIMVLAMLLAVSLAVFSSDLANKYSIKVLRKGSGAVPQKGDRIKVHYEGRLKDGRVFDSSYVRNIPLPVTAGAGQVIKCWDDVVLQMEVGSKVSILCPASTAYGPRRVGSIPANSDLSFIIERLE